MKTENTNPLSAITFRHWLIALSLALLAACSSDSGNSWNAEDVCPESLRGNFQDKRDGKWYSYTTIGDQVWMAENLDYKNDTYYCADKYIENYCAIYGGLYNFPEWDSIQTICPEGWHLPSKAEWEELIETMGGKKAINKGVLRAQEGWHLNDKFAGTDLCGFAALPAEGDYNYKYPKKRTYWWTATLTSPGFAHVYFLAQNYEEDYNEFTVSGINDSRSYPIRCVKDK